MTMQSTMPMPMSMPMPMPMPGMMNGMPMQAMMPMMMASMKMKMVAGKTECEMVPAAGMDKDMFASSCQMLQMMVEAGMPITMQSGNMCMMAVSDHVMMTPPVMMPPMATMPSMMCRVQVELKKDAMVCQMSPGQGMNAEMFTASCKLMEKMMQIGMPMMIACNGSPVMCCTA